MDFLASLRILNWLLEESCSAVKERLEDALEDPMLDVGLLLSDEVLGRVLVLEPSFVPIASPTNSKFLHESTSETSFFFVVSIFIIIYLII